MLEDMQVPFPNGKGFTAADYAELHSLIFRGDYPGYTPAVREAPNGDGAVDADKRYAHISLKNLARYSGTAKEKHLLLGALALAHSQAEYVAEALNVPAAFRPDIRYGALRVLEYPPGARSARHADVGLFTLHLYRNIPEAFWREDVPSLPAAALALNPGLHLGKLAEEIGIGRATYHGVDACERVQRSIVYFAIPNHDLAMLLDGGHPSYLTVGSWIEVQMRSMRVPA